MGSPHKGSLTDKLSHLRVGERLFVEARADTFQRVQSAATGTRIKNVLGDVKFSTKVWTAVGEVGEAIVLVGITRTQ